MRKLSILTAITAALVITGCNKEDGNGPDPGQFGEATEITLAIEHTKGTRAPETDALESKISTLEFYVFDGTGNTPDPKVGTATEPGYVKITSTALTHKLTVSAGVDKKFFVIANANIGAMQAGVNDTYEKMKKYISSGEFLGDENLSNHNARVIPSAGLEMAGFTEKSITGGKADNRVDISVKRLASKVTTPELGNSFEVAIQYQDQIDQIWGDDSGVTPSSTITFEFKGFALINGVTKSTVTFTGNADEDYTDPQTKPWDTWTWVNHSTNPAPRIASKFDTNGNYLNNYSGPQGSEWFFDGTTDHDRVYLYESMPIEESSSTVDGFNFKTVVALIIKGELTTTGQSPATRYWRVNLTKDDYYHIMRNSIYNVTISKITTPGYGTPKEAEEEDPVIPKPDDTAADFIITVEPWDIKSYETEM